MNKFLIILLLFISLTTLCQESDFVVDIDAGSELALLTENNEIEYSTTVQTEAESYQVKSTSPLESKWNYIILPLISEKITVVRNRVFPEWDPVFSLFLKRNILYSGKHIINSGFSNSFNLAVSFDAGLRLPLSDEVLLDIGIKDEFGVSSNRKLHLKEYINNDSRSIGLTLGVSYKIR